MYRLVHIHTLHGLINIVSITVGLIDRYGRTVLRVDVQPTGLQLGFVTRLYSKKISC
jgi:hypothetical protein